MFKFLDGQASYPEGMGFSVYFKLLIKILSIKLYFLYLYGTFYDFPTVRAKCKESKLHCFTWTDWTKTFFQCGSLQLSLGNSIFLTKMPNVTYWHGVGYGIQKIPKYYKNSGLFLWHSTCFFPLECLMNPIENKYIRIEFFVTFT